MPFEPGAGNPNLVDRDRLRAMSTGGHPYSLEHPSVEALASDQYQKVIAAVARAYRVEPSRIQHSMRALMQANMQAMMHAMQVQEAHVEELEQLAVRAVLDLPEFEAAKEAVESGDLRIDAKLQGDEVDVSGAPLEDKGEDFHQDFNVEQVARELDDEVHRRRLLNAMTQGAAINKNRAHAMFAQELNALDPELVRSFSAVMSFAELMYFAMPEAQQKMAMEAGAGAAGSVELKVDEESVPTIRARAALFPVLIQEIVKGLMEYLAHNDEEDPEVRRHARGRADHLMGEVWDINVGPALYRKFLGMIPDGKMRYVPHVYADLAKLPAGQFKRVMQGIAHGSPEVKRQIATLVRNAEMAEAGEARDTLSGEDDRY